MPDLALEGGAEALQKRIASEPRIGQRFQRDDEDFGRFDSAVEFGAGEPAKIATGGVIVRPEIDAALLRRGFGEKGNAPPARHQPQRLGAAPFERRQHDRADAVQIGRRIGRRRGFRN